MKQLGRLDPAIAKVLLQVLPTQSEFQELETALEQNGGLEPAVDNRMLRLGAIPHVRQRLQAVLTRNEFPVSF
jgi:hypothetical protein|tara:strand:- start:345 stop:563 length:219 start_codon:yes stop_codon:yes gene_type:complete